MTILFTANTANELGGVMLGFSDPGDHTSPFSVATQFGTGAAFLGYDSDYATEAAGVNIGQSVSYIGFAVNTPVPTGDYWCHARICPGVGVGSTSADGYLWTFFDENNAIVARVEAVDGQYRAAAIGDTTVTAGSGVTPVQYVPMTLDVRISVGANIDIDLYSNGVLVSSATAANTGSKGAPTVFQCDHNDLTSSNPGTGTWFFYSEVIITDGESTVGWRLATLQPNAQGANNDMAGAVSNLVDANDGLTISSDTVGDRKSWTLTAYGGPASPSGIRGVVTKTKSQSGLTGPQTMRHHLRLGGVDYDSGVFAPSPDGEMVVWDDNPSDSTAWDTADLTGMEQGVEVET